MLSLNFNFEIPDELKISEEAVFWLFCETWTFYQQDSNGWRFVERLTHNEIFSREQYFVNYLCGLVIGAIGGEMIPLDMAWQIAVEIMSRPKLQLESFFAEKQGRKKKAA